MSKYHLHRNPRVKNWVVYCFTCSVLSIIQWINVKALDKCTRLKLWKAAHPYTQSKLVNLPYWTLK